MQREKGFEDGSGWGVEVFQSISSIFGMMIHNGSYIFV
jgi:hypothetical protein